MPTSSLVGSTNTVAGGIRRGNDAFATHCAVRLTVELHTQAGLEQTFSRTSTEFRRCRRADQVLRDRPNVVRVFITAQLEDRVRTVSEEQHLRMANAQKKVEEIDRLRANYYGELDGKVWGQADNYDVCLNISAIDEAGAVYMIEKAVEGKLIQMDLKAAH